jgi:hypothetical protein
LAERIVWPEAILATALKTLGGFYFGEGTRSAEDEALNIRCRTGATLNDSRFAFASACSIRDPSKSSNRADGEAKHITQAATDNISHGIFLSF